MSALLDSSQIAETAQDMPPIFNPSLASDHVDQHSSLPWAPRDLNETSKLQNFDANMCYMVSIAPGFITNIPGDELVETDHTVAYLLKHFSEKPGKW